MQLKSLQLQLENLNVFLEDAKNKGKWHEEIARIVDQIKEVDCLQNEGRIFLNEVQINDLK